MRIRQHSERFWRETPSIATGVRTGLGILLGVAVGWYIAEHGISYREVILVLMALVGVVTFLLGETGVRFGFALWVWTLSLGYRTIQVSPYLRVHPAEILLIWLLVLLIAERRILSGRPIEAWLPTWLYGFMPFWLWAWVPGLLADQPFGRMFDQFRNFALFVPLLLVTANVLTERKNWFPIILSFYGVGTWIAAMGVLEYFAPGIASLFPDFMLDPAPSETIEGFSRASFSFWGSSAATFICVLTLPLVGALWKHARRTSQRALLLAALFLQVVGVFIGGYRSMWLIVCVQLLVWAGRRYGAILGLLMGLVTGVVVYWLAPAPVSERVQSLVLTLEGRPDDSSGVERWERVTTAAEATLRQPWGYGWAGTGWVHSDFVQAAAAMGLVAGVVFLGAYAFRLRLVWRHARKPRDDDEGSNLGFSLLLSFAAVGWLLTTQNVVVLPQLALPIWLVWVLVEIWLRQMPRERHT